MASKHKRSGHGRIGRIVTRLLARALPIGRKEHASAHGMDPQCLSPKNSKQAAFYISRLISVSQGKCKKRHLNKARQEPALRVDAVLGYHRPHLK